MLEFRLDYSNLEGNIIADERQRVCYTSSYFGGFKHDLYTG